MQVFREIVFTRYSGLSQEALDEAVIWLNQRADCWLLLADGQETASSAKRKVISEVKTVVAGADKKSGSCLKHSLTLTYQNLPGKAVEVVQIVEFVGNPDRLAAKQRDLDNKLYHWKAVNSVEAPFYANRAVILSEEFAAEPCLLKLDPVIMLTYTLSYIEVEG